MKPDTNISGIDKETINASPKAEVPKTSATNNSLINPKNLAAKVAKTAQIMPFQFASLFLFCFKIFILSFPIAS